MIKEKKKQRKEEHSENVAYKKKLDFYKNESLSDEYEEMFNLDEFEVNDEYMRSQY